MIVTPFEVVKIRLQQQQGSNKAALLYKVCAAAALALALGSHILVLRRSKPPNGLASWRGVPRMPSVCLVPRFHTDCR